MTQRNNSAPKTRLMGVFRKKYNDFFDFFSIKINGLIG